VKFMLWLRDKVGLEAEEYVFDKKPSLKDLVDEITSRHPTIAKLLENPWSAENPIIILVNGLKKGEDHILEDGDEVVLLPPVSGG